MLIPEEFVHLPYPNVRTPLWPTLTAAVILVISSCWRLAKFNLDTRQTTGFLGLPTPANGLFWVSVTAVSAGIAVHHGPGHEVLVEVIRALLAQPYSLLGVSLVFSALMLSELPLPSLKFKHFKWKGNEVMFLLLGIGLVLVVLYGVLAVPLILVLYLLSPLWGRLFRSSGVRSA
ncbi:MAG: CDP-alcohol phosphatidyltransferase family protein [Flavobacteriales bacterium]